jgi:predicted metal-binding membrane protein
MTTDSPLAASHRTRAPGLLITSAAIFAASTAATIYFCISMSGGMEMPGGWTMSMMWMRMPGQTQAGAAGMFLLMWLVMMVAMMLPSALPMLMGYRRAMAARESSGTAPAVVLVACGYFFVWFAIGAGVYAAGVAFASAAMRFPALGRVAPALSGIALIVAGCMQFTSWKMAALCRCRAGVACPSCIAPESGWTPWRRGLEQGFFCAICCAAPMLALLALGAMNLAAMAVVAVAIAMEKLMPGPERVVRIFGVAAVVAGMVVTVRALPGHG